MNRLIFDRQKVSIPPVPKGLVIERVLYEAESPIVFVSRTEDGQQLLAIVVEDEPQSTSTLLTPASDETVAGLLEGHVSVREAFTSSWLWLHHRGDPEDGVWVVSIEEVADYLPNPSTPLLPSLTPVLVTRALGDQVVRGRMPASVVAFVADATRRAVKTVLDNLLSAQSGGRPPERHRALYDLPVRSFHFASFEVSFGMPDPTLFGDGEVKQAVEMLGQGLLWASESSDTPFVANDAAEKEAILRAALLLTPPAGGYVDEVHISGEWLSHDTPIKLTRRSRRRVREQLRAVDSEQVVRYEGRIGEADVDKLSFTLRDTEDGQDRKATFERELLDEVLDLLEDKQRVAVAGLERMGQLYASAISRLPSGHR